MKFPINSLHVCEISKEIRQIFKNFVKILYMFIKCLGNFRIIRYIFVKFPRHLSNSQEICQNSDKFLIFLLNFWEIRQKGVYRAFSELGKALVSEVPGASWGRPGASWERPGGVPGAIFSSFWRLIYRPRSRSPFGNHFRTIFVHFGS